MKSPSAWSAAQPREPRLLSSRIKWWPRSLEAGQSNCLGRVIHVCLWWFLAAALKCSGCRVTAGTQTPPVSTVKQMSRIKRVPKSMHINIGIHFHSNLPTQMYHSTHWRWKESSFSCGGKKREQLWLADWRRYNVGLVVERNSLSRRPRFHIWLCPCLFLQLLVKQQTQSLWHQLIFLEPGELHRFPNTHLPLASPVWGKRKKEKKNDWLNPVPQCGSLSPRQTTVRGTNAFMGNHRRCGSCDVWHGVVTQNYLSLWWGTQRRDFRVKSEKEQRRREREFQSYFQSLCRSGLIFKVTIHMHHYRKKKERGERKWDH